jgi:hypothetical protein
MADEPPLDTFGELVEKREESTAASQPCVVDDCRGAREVPCLGGQGPYLLRLGHELLDVVLAEVDVSSFKARAHQCRRLGLAHGHQTRLQVAIIF